MKSTKAWPARFALAWLLLGSGPTFAATASGAPSLPARAPQDTNFTLEGKITQRSSGKLTVSSGQNMVFHVCYTDKTEIQQADGSAGSEKDLRVGVKVRVEGDLAESGEIAARKIEIEKESGAEKRPSSGGR